MRRGRRGDLAQRKKPRCTSPAPFGAHVARRFRGDLARALCCRYVRLKFCRSVPLSKTFPVYNEVQVFERSAGGYVTQTFYDDLAPYYKYAYANWDASVKRQAAVLDGVIREFAGANACTVLDAACGVGTQSLGLAALGYQVTASDLSVAEVERAQAEAARRALAIDFRVADMRSVWDVYGRSFDVVMACDNSVPHLLTDADILQAFEQFYRCTAPDGCCIVTVRDYARLDRRAGERKMVPRLVHTTEQGQLVLLDVWTFEDADQYTITMYVIEDNGGTDVTTRAIRGGRYYCVTLPTLERLLHQAGFRQVVTLRDRFFQPLLVATR